VEFLAWLEADGFARGDGDFRAGAGVAADSGFAGLDGEDAKATEFNAVSANEALLHAVEDGVDSGFGFDSRQAGSLNNPLNQVLLNHVGRRP